jgi:hypothetical protein
MMAIKLDPTAGTWDGSNSLSVSISVLGFGIRTGTPYTLQAPSGTYSRVTGYPVFGVRSTTDTFGFPVETLTNTVIDSGTTPDEMGFAFTLPSGWGATYTVKGLIILVAKPTNSAQTFDIVLYSSDGTTVLQSVTYDSEYFGTASGAASFRTCEFYFDEVSLSSLSFGTKYYITIKPSGTSGDITFHDFSVRQSSDMQAFPLGESCFLATKVDGGSPSETTTRRPYVGLIFDDITEPSGGAGGLLTHSGMAGGLVG